MPAVAKKASTESMRTVSVIALTHAFQDLKRYRRGDEATIALADGAPLPAWCILESEAPRTRDGAIDLNALPLFFPANARG